MQRTPLAPTLAAVALLAGLLAPASGVHAAHVSPASLVRPAAPGDFNGDGRPDLGIGVPQRRVGTVEGAGVVVVRLRGSTDPARVISLASRHVPGRPRFSGLFGAELASGDFDGDGHADLAVGAPNDTVGENGLAGSVTVLYGSAHGIRLDRTRRFTQDSAGVPGSAGGFKSFGAGLLAADLNGDGLADLAVGAPSEEVGSVGSAGSVTLLFGTPSGLTAHGSRRFTQATRGVAGTPAFNGVFGIAFAAGDTDGDGYRDLMVGAPHFDGGDGVVLVVPGSGSGPRLRRSYQLQADHTVGLGLSLASGDVDADGYDDLLAGAPATTVAGRASAGAVVLFPGGPRGVRSTTRIRVTEATQGVPREPRRLDQFGRSVAMGDLDRNGRDEAVVGAPGHIVDGHRQAGAVVVIKWTTRQRIAVARAKSFALDPAVDGDRFGERVEVSNVIGDRHPDVLADISGKDIREATDCGAVEVLPGSSAGATAAGARQFTQGSLRAGAPASYDAFGLAIAG